MRVAEGKTSKMSLGICAIVFAAMDAIAVLRGAGDSGSPLS
jgi:hypothetical protein